MENILQIIGLISIITTIVKFIVTLVCYYEDDVKHDKFYIFNINRSLYKGLEYDNCCIIPNISYRKTKKKYNFTISWLRYNYFIEYEIKQED